MKIAIPVDEKDIKGNLCISFGRAPYFLIYDTEDKETSFIENTASQSRGGAGIKAAQIVVDNKVDALVTPRCGENAAQVIEVASIKIYKSQGSSIEENIDKYINDQLPIMNEIHSGFHGHGEN